MQYMPNVVIVMARCNHNKESFGIRIEEKKPDQWIIDWAFAIPEKTSQKEGYNHNRVHGTFALDTEYPGCPYCQNRSIFQCICNKVSCYDGESGTAVCPWCNTYIELGGQIKHLQGGGDLL